METIQVVLDSKLLQAADEVARRAKLTRSALIREALREHLKRMEIRQLEERDRKGYQIRPQLEDELSGWEGEAAWPWGSHSWLPPRFRAARRAEARLQARRPDPTAQPTK